jgi:acetyltransferase-like isoleucine patch superfamily enzyme
MNQAQVTRPRIAETVVESTVRLRDAKIGRCCAIAAQVRIGAPNHPLDRPSLHRFTYCPEYYVETARCDHAFFQNRRTDRVVIGHDVWIGHGAIVLPGVTVGNGAVPAAKRREGKARCCASRRNMLRKRDGT